MATIGSALFDRRCRITVAIPVDEPGNFSDVQTTDVVEIDGGRTDRPEASGMRIEFKIERSLKKDPNSSLIVVTNLAEKTRKSLQRKGVRVLVEAGYRDVGMCRLFSGDVRSVDQIREAADWRTSMRLGDGERAWRFARVQESFAPGARVSDVVRKAARALGIELGNADAQAATIDRVLDQGWTLAGNAARALDQILTSVGKEWSIQDGQLQILDPYEAVDLPIPEITPSSGLVGSPEMGTPPGKGKPALLKFKALLFATKPGAKVRLRSQRYDGFVRVHKCSFSGDTHGGEWYTTVEGTISS